jgi:glycine/D-amino acid oxidase-like deaminating enzyme
MVSATLVAQGTRSPTSCWGCPRTRRTRRIRHRTDPYVVVHPADNVLAVTGLGGHGMTMSFRIAEVVVHRALDDEVAQRS